jgi:hypothetical protein
MLSEGTPLSFESARQRFKWMAVARQRFYNGMCWIRPVSLGHTLDSLGVTWTNYDGLKGYTVDTTICLYIYIHIYIYIYIHRLSFGVWDKKSDERKRVPAGELAPRPGQTRPHQATPANTRPLQAVCIYISKSSNFSPSRSQILIP